jgi:hypothetical protein
MRVNLGPASSHLAALPSPRHEGNVGQVPEENYLVKEQPDD